MIFTIFAADVPGLIDSRGRPAGMPLSSVLMAPQRLQVVAVANRSAPQLGQFAIDS